MKIKALSQNIVVKFNSSSKAGKGFSSFNQWIKKAIRKNLTKKEGENGDYMISKLSVRDHDDFFVFDVEAETKESIEWQLSNIQNFIKSLPGVCSFHAQILGEIGEIYWNED